MAKFKHSVVSVHAILHNKGTIRTKEVYNNLERLYHTSDIMLEFTDKQSQAGLLLDLGDEVMFRPVPVCLKKG